MAYIGDDIEVLPPVRLGTSSGAVAGAVPLGSVNIFLNWSLDLPVVGRVNYIPAIVLEADQDVPSETLPGTVILRKALT